MEPLEMLQTLFEIGQRIYDRVQTVKANKSQCQRLGKRVGVVLDACRGLDKASDLQQYRAGLESLQRTLNDTLQFISKFTSKRWYKKFISAKSHNEQFAELAEHLWKDVQLLQLGLGAQQIVNRDEDKVDMGKDLTELQAGQEEILRLNREQNEQLLKIHFDQTEQQKLVAKQLASLREQLQVDAKSKPANKPLLDPKLAIPFYQLEFTKKLAQGSFASVYQGHWLQTLVAIKLIDRHLSEADLQRFSREVEIMSRLRHPNVVQLYSACVEPGRACMVMEYMQQQSLRKVLDTNVVLTIADKYRLARHICQGLYYLHQQGVLHRDLRSSNVLLSDQAQVAKLSDFGLAKINTLSVQSAKGSKPVWQYLAPELLRHGGKVTEQTDIYSLGIVLWELYTGQRPYAVSKLTPDAVLKDKRDAIPQRVPAMVGELIQGCWQTKPYERVSLEELMAELDRGFGQQLDPKADSLYQQGKKAEANKEHQQAFTLYSQAGKLGHMKANTNKAYYLLTGRGGIAKDKAQAYQLMVMTAEAGHDKAQFNLGQMLEYGDGVDKDCETAAHYYQLAAKQHYPNAKEKYEKLAESEAASAAASEAVAIRL